MRNWVEIFCPKTQILCNFGWWSEMIQERHRSIKATKQMDWRRTEFESSAKSLRLILRQSLELYSLVLELTRQRFICRSTMKMVGMLKTLVWVFCNKSFVGHWEKMTDQQWDWCELQRDWVWIISTTYVVDFGVFIATLDLWKILVWSVLSGPFNSWHISNNQYLAENQLPKFGKRFKLSWSFLRSHLPLLGLWKSLEVMCDCSITYQYVSTKLLWQMMHILIGSITEIYLQ